MHQKRQQAIPQPPYRGLSVPELDHNPFVRELTDRVLQKLGYDRTLFQVPNGFVRCNKRKDNIAKRATVYETCLNTKTRFGNYPSVKELALDFGVPHSTILDNISRATRSANAERSGQTGHTRSVVESRRERQAGHVRSHAENGHDQPTERRTDVLADFPAHPDQTLNRYVGVEGDDSGRACV